MVFVSHYDPGTKTFTFVNDDLDLSELETEVRRVKDLAYNWIKRMERGLITPPYTEHQSAKECQRVPI